MRNRQDDDDRLEPMFPEDMHGIPIEPPTLTVTEHAQVHDAVDLLRRDPGEDSLRTRVRSYLADVASGDVGIHQFRDLREYVESRQVQFRDHVWAAVVDELIARYG